MMDYTEGIGWHDARIVPYAPIAMDPATMVLHYAQETFEGLKAYTTEDGHIVTFRPDLNASRLADSARRLEMPVFPEERFVDAVQKVVEANAAYVPPYGSGATLYIRPYMMGTNPVIGVKPATDHISRVAQSQLPSVSVTMTVQHLAEPVISKLV